MSISIRAAATVAAVLATLLSATPAHAHEPAPPRWSVTGPHGGPTATVVNVLASESRSSSTAVQA